MGGPSGYSRDVDEGRRSTRESFSFAKDIERERRANPAKVVKEIVIAPHFDPKKKRWECRDIGKKITLPIALVIDLTLSRGEDVGTAFDKIPLLMGSMVSYGIANLPEISIAGVGDYGCNDRFPVQISDFESDEKIDRNLKTIIVEEGGGGNGIESYATTVFGYARFSDLDANKRGKKGYMFVLGDEGFYKTVTKGEIKSIYGIDVEKDIESSEIFREAQEKYHVFFIYVKKSWETRKKGIDAEIEKRVKERGGVYEEVSVRASLIWNTCDDLDLHAIAPSGEEIYFSHMRSQCGGELDVDTNAGGCQTRKAVENIRWKKGKAPEGQYHIFVRNFAYHDPDSKNGAIPFKVELAIDGKIEYFEGETPARATGSQSDITCFRFYYDPNESKKSRQEKVDPYAAYQDNVVLDYWKKVLPEENILVLEDPKAIVDAMIGAIRLTEGGSLDDYIVDMEKRRQTEGRRTEIRGALTGLSGVKTAVTVEKSGLPKKPVKKAGK